MPIYSTAGNKLFIGAALAAKSADFVAGDFTTALSGATEVKWLENLGNLGDESEEVTFDAIGEQRTQTLKGTRKAAAMEVVCGNDPLDAGQLALIAAEKTGLDYAFRVEFTDKPSAGASPKNSTRLFIAKVMSAPEQFGGANDVTKISFNLQPNSNIVRVAASAT